MGRFKYTESDLENAVLEWLEKLGYSVAFGPDIAFDGESPERESYKDIILLKRLGSAVAKINPNIPQNTREVSDAASAPQAVPP